MKLKLDDKGQAVLQDGCPVYVYDDGREAPFDAATTLNNYTQRIANLEEEKTRHYTKSSQYKEDLKKFEGIDPEKARAAMATVQNLKDKQLLDSQGIEALKTEMRSSFDGEKKQLVDNHNKALQLKDADIQERDATIHDLLVTQRFHMSDYFTGENPKTIYPPEDAAKIFGHHFFVEQVQGTNKRRVIAKDSDGNVVMSRKNHGDPAGFDEAMQIIIDKHPNKNRFLASGKGGGPDTYGNTGPGAGDVKGAGLTKIATGLKKQFGNRF